MAKFIKTLFISTLVLVCTFCVTAGEIVHSYDKDGIAYTEWREENGFRWIKMWDRKSRGVQTPSGEIIIPLSRNYSDILYLPKADHPDGGYFSVEMGENSGVVDIRGREIIAPNKYKHVIWVNGKYSATNNGKDFIDLRYPSVNSNNNSASSTPVNNNTTPSSKVESYIYTESGRGQSQTTGQWTDGGPGMDSRVEFFDDHITVNGTYCKYLKTEGSWKVYSGLNMFGSANYYHVDGNKNMKKVSVCSSAYGTDTFVYPMSRNGDPTPNGGGYTNSGGGSNNYNSQNNGGNSTNTARPARQFKCAYCNGAGRIERNDNAPASFGQRRPNKRCDECGKTYDPNVFTHYHVQCGHCGGTGNTK